MCPMPTQPLNHIRDHLKIDEDSRDCTQFGPDFQQILADAHLTIVLVLVSLPDVKSNIVFSLGTIGHRIALVNTVDTAFMKIENWPDL
jgi:hypothetical protein